MQITSSNIARTTTSYQPKTFSPGQLQFEDRFVKSQPYEIKLMPRPHMPQVPAAASPAPPAPRKGLLKGITAAAKALVAGIAGAIPVIGVPLQAGLAFTASRNGGGLLANAAGSLAVATNLIYTGQPLGPVSMALLGVSGVTAALTVFREESR